MKSFQRFALAAVAAALLLPTAVDGAAYYSPIVVCLEEVCVGNSFFTSPSPASMCENPDDPATCNTVYVGGWTWEYHFIKGGYYEEGTDLSLENPQDVAAAETGLIVSVSLNDDESTCAIKIGNETCAKCSASKCTGSNVTYDCSNINMGSKSMDNDCEPLEPIFYPLIIETLNNNGTDSSSSMAMANDATTTAETTFGDGSGSSTSAHVMVVPFQILLLASLVLVAGAGFLL